MCCMLFMIRMFQAEFGYFMHRDSNVLQLCRISRKLSPHYGSSHGPWRACTMCSQHYNVWMVFGLLAIKCVLWLGLIGLLDGRIFLLLLGHRKCLITPMIVIDLKSVGVLKSQESCVKSLQLNSWDPACTKSTIHNIDYWAWSVTYWDPAGTGISTTHGWNSYNPFYFWKENGFKMFGKKNYTSKPNKYSISSIPTHVTQQVQNFLLTKGGRVEILLFNKKSGSQMFGKTITHLNLTEVS